MSIQDIQVAVPSPSIQMTPWRPRRQGKLALLPTEILLQITGEPGKDGGSMSYRDLKGLAVSCSRLFHFIRPMYYFADDHAVFHSAVAHGDLEAIGRCAQLGAAPRLARKLHHSCSCPSEHPHKVHRPFDSLLEYVATGSVPVGKSLDVLKWLLDEGFEANEQMDQPWYRNGNEDCDHMPELLVTILSQSKEQTRTNAIIKMIEILQSHGFCLPYQMNIRKRYHLYLHNETDVDLIKKPLDVALRLRCPPSFLRLILEEYKRRNLDVKAGGQLTPPEIARWAGHSEGNRRGWRRQRTSLGTMVGNMFLDIFNPSTSWKEADLSKAADSFQEKIQLLKDYQAVNSHELTVLKSILESLKDITTLSKRVRGLDNERDAKECWQRLCEALRPFATKQALIVDSQRRLSYEDICAPLHRFVFEVDWNPWKLWFEHKLQDPEFRAEMSFCWTQHDFWKLRQDENGIWYDNQWEYVHSYRQNSSDLPRWHLVDFDGFVAAVEKQWLKLNPYFLTSTIQDSNGKV
ncbi:hypothetical protein LB503_005610 [Fusarium chuoi]|nr:hypothetical protein LB503_005610 [Fusarium chuoi]